MAILPTTTHDVNISTLLVTSRTTSKKRRWGERDAEIDRSKNKIKERVMIKTADV